MIESGLLKEPTPQQDRQETQYRPIPRCPLHRFYVNEADVTRVIEFDVALGDWGVASWTDRHLSELPFALLRSSSVLIGTHLLTGGTWAL